MPQNILDKSLTSVTINKDCLSCQPGAGRFQVTNHLGDVRMFVTRSDSSWKLDKRPNFVLSHVVAILYSILPNKSCD